MNIILPLKDDSHNSDPSPDGLELRRGSARPNNCVIIIGDRQVEVNMDELKKAVSIL
jgi:hypothetical protein